MLRSTRKMSYQHIRDELDKLQMTLKCLEVCSRLLQRYENGLTIGSFESLAKLQQPGAVRCEFFMVANEIFCPGKGPIHREILRLAGYDLVQLLDFAWRQFGLL